MSGLHGDIDEIVNNGQCESKACNNKHSAFPVTALKNRGFQVYQVDKESFIVKAIRGRLKAKIVNNSDNDIIKKIINECYGEECELIDEPPMMWDVKRIADNKFLITRKRG